MGLRGSVFAMITSPHHLVALLLRDGSIYFVFMACAVLSNIISFYVFPSLLRGVFTTFSICVAVTMVSRLMLNLHQSTDGEILTPPMSCLQEVAGDDAPMFTTHFDHWHPSALSDDRD
ncbi:hypothetical protein SCLCIDRAFT_1212993 [Scleroderma citrinum Foug A]|uniref:Uncharacterized protein n=1 Tax=Scleroderma citrinum Foug A TaxID=1036808 RepID=A0A0C3DWD7_9AGAM|nr:hypothetical protein SCLCIDRAFT_1212993 [Scleroderma citrinum Foug A]